MRYDSEHESAEVISALNSRVDRIFFTCRKAKRPFMFARGISIDVWIDDEPTFIITDAKE